MLSSRRGLAISDHLLFADVNRWLEAVVDSEVLTPRTIIASVPWTLVAQQANGLVPDQKAIVVDCGADDVLQDAIDAAGPRVTLRVEGTCNENITIHAWQTRLTLDGQGAASIAPAGGGPAVTIFAARFPSTTLRLSAVGQGASLLRRLHQPR